MNRTLSLNSNRISSQNRNQNRKIVEKIEVPTVEKIEAPTAEKIEVLTAEAIERQTARRTVAIEVTDETEVRSAAGVQIVVAVPTVDMMTAENRLEPLT